MTQTHKSSQTMTCGKAVLVHTGIKEEAAWLPLSQITLRPSGIGGIYTLTVPERVAIDKGLV
jgi:hypothetical protein